MRHSKIVKVGKDEIKIDVSLWVQKGEFEYNHAVFKKAKKDFTVMLPPFNEDVCKEIYQCKLELWEQLKPKDE